MASSTICSYPVAAPSSRTPGSSGPPLSPSVLRVASVGCAPGPMPSASARAKSSRWAAVVGGFTARASPSSSKKLASAGMSCGVPSGSPSGGGGGAAGAPVSALRGRRLVCRLMAVTLAMSAWSSTRNRPSRKTCGVVASMRSAPAGSSPVPTRRVDHPGAGAASGRPRSDVGERLGPRAEELVREVAIGDLGQREHHRFGAQVEHGDRVHRVAVGRHDGPALRPGQIVLPEQPVDPDQAAEALQGAHRHDRGVTRHIRPGCQLDVGRLLARRAVGRCVAPAVPSPVPSPLEHADRASEPARSAAATRRAPDGPSPGRSERSERIMSTAP
jgi:hypothetical protein